MTPTQRQLTCDALFQAQGYAPSGSAAIVGNFTGESGPELSSLLNRQRADHDSGGIGEWRAERKAGLISFCQAKGWNPEALSPQVAWTIHELETDYQALNTKLKAGGDISALTAEFCWTYERPNKTIGAASLNKIRIPAAEAVFMSSDHAALRTPETQKNIHNITAKRTLETHNGNAGLAVVSAGALWLIHELTHMPLPITMTLAGIAGMTIVYSLVAAQKTALSIVPAAIPEAPAAEPVRPKDTPLTLEDIPMLVRTLAPLLAADLSAELASTMLPIHKDETHG
jgi:hypothetical protein